jgi:hypothetical protein
MTRHTCIQCYALLPAEHNMYFCSALCYMEARRPGSPPLQCLTAYGFKRRMLRVHREEMRIMTDILVEHNLDEVLEARVVYETGEYSQRLMEHPQMDEDSDDPDPILALRGEVRGLREEATDRQAFIAAAQSVVSGQQSAELVGVLLKDLERARMSLEDVRR